MSSEDSLATALLATAESASLDFKQSFSPALLADWLELIKDIAAIANSGGGLILIGVRDDGTPSAIDVSSALSLDPADIGNKVHKYTGVHFHDFEILGCQRNEYEICALRIGPAEVPLVFTNVGTYESQPGKQKTAFSVGTVYFRHGAKSEPGNTEDLRKFVDRRLELIRKSWLDGISKVVEAPPGSRIAIMPPRDAMENEPGAVPLRLVDDPSAPAYYAVPIDRTHPYRQKEVIQQVNARLTGKRAITAHTIVCIRRVFSIQKDIKFCYTQNYASPRYSDAFVDWIVAQYEANERFFEETKAKFDQLKFESKVDAT